MRKLTLIAALLMTTTCAHAGNSIAIEIDGHKVRIEAPKNCDQLSCLKISGFDFKGFSSRRFDDDDDGAVKSDAPAQKASPAPPVQATSPQTPAAAAADAALAPVAPTSPRPAVTDDGAPTAPAVASTAARPAQIAAAPVQPGTTPIGVWATEENKGQVRIEQCGQNLCGYAVKTGEKILINMKPSDAKWIGLIHDPDSGRNYDSSISLKGANSLRVQGCAFGGLFCGGQIWNRAS